MIKIVNTFFSILKLILLLVCFVFSFFIIINMYRRLDKDIFSAIFNFIPYIILFLLFAINLIFKQKSVNDCLFYNLTCCLVFMMILFCVYRTFCDQNMVVYVRLGYNINFNYFADIIAPMRAMLYILSFSNVLLIFDGYEFKRKKKEVLVGASGNLSIIKKVEDGVNVVNFKTKDFDAASIILEKPETVASQVSVDKSNHEIL